MSDTATRRPANALTIGELDPLGIDGIAIDLRAFATMAVRGFAVHTAWRRRFEVELDRVELDPSDVTHQLASLARVPVDATKIRPLGGPSLIRTLAEVLESGGMGHTVIDVGAVSRTGDTTLAATAIEALRDHLLRRAHLVVLNTDEVELLTHRRAHDPGGMRDAARWVSDFGSSQVLVTGGRTDGHAIDIFFDGSGFVEFGADRVTVPQPRSVAGLGSTFTASIAAGLARGSSAPDAIDLAKRVARRALADAHTLGSALAVEPMAARYHALGVDVAPVEVAETPAA